MKLKDRLCFLIPFSSMSGTAAKKMTAAVLTKILSNYNWPICDYCNRADPTKQILHRMNEGTNRCCDNKCPIIGEE